MTVHELVTEALRSARLTRPAWRERWLPSAWAARSSASINPESSGAAPSASSDPPPADVAWLHAVTATHTDIDHLAPSHVATAHLAPVAPWGTRNKVDLAALLIRGLAIAGLICLMVTAFAEGWITAAAHHLSGWWATDIAPYFAITIVEDTQPSAGMPVGR